MSRKLLIGSTEYAWPNDGDLNWGQDVFNWAEAISRAVNEGSGGGGTSFTVGTGLTLSDTSVLSISDGGVGTTQLADAAVTAAKLVSTAPTNTSMLAATPDGPLSWVPFTTITEALLPSGGTTGQVLAKSSDNNYEVTWVAAAEAGVEDLSGVRGGSGITVTHTQSNEIATVAVTDSIQGALVPTGGDAGQVLTKNSGTDHDLNWTSFTAGQGLLLTGHEFSIPDHSISYSLIDRDITRYIFGAELSLGFGDDIEIDGLKNVDIETDSDGTIHIFPRDTGTTFYELIAGPPRPQTFASSDSTQEFGTAMRGDIIYRCTYDSSNQEITHFRAFNLDGTRRAQSDITIATPITLSDPNDATYFIYNEFHQRFYFTTGSVLWVISLDGVSYFDDSQDGPGDQMINMDQYIAFTRPGFFNLPELFVYDPSDLDSGSMQFIVQFLFPRSALNNFTHYNIIKDGEFFHALTGYQKGFTEAFQLTTFYAYNGPIDRVLVDNIITPAKLRTTNINAKDGQILSLNGNNFTWIDSPSGGGSIQDGSITPAKLDSTNTPSNRDLLYYNGNNDEFAWDSIQDLIRPTSITYDKLENAFNWVDNGGVITKAIGFENIALVYKQQTTIGSNNSEWVPANLDDIFELRAGQIGTNPSTAQHNYDLKFRDGAIKKYDINPVDDLENLIGINFVRNAATVTNGEPLRPRLAIPWQREDRTLFVDDRFSTTEVKFTIPRTRVRITRGITHILIKAGRMSGVTNNTSRTDIINGIQTESNTYHEVVVPVSSSYAKNNTVGGRPGFDRYNVLFASGVSCAIEVKSNEDGTTDITAEVNDTTSALNGQEFLAFYAMRSIGG